MPTKSNNTGGQGGARPGAGRKKKPLSYSNLRGFGQKKNTNFVSKLAFLFGRGTRT